jgi:hypothetical protein
VHETRKADVWIRKRIAERRRHDGVQLRGRAPRDLLRDEHVGQQRAVRPVLLGGARGNDDGVVLLEKGLDLGIRHFPKEYGRWLHRGRGYLPVTGRSNGAK